MKSDFYVLRKYHIGILVSVVVVVIVVAVIFSTIFDATGLDIF
jgi:hypothetical protein